MANVRTDGEHAHRWPMRVGPNVHPELVQYSLESKVVCVFVCLFVSSCLCLRVFVWLLTLLMKQRLPLAFDGALRRDVPLHCVFVCVFGCVYVHTYTHFRRTCARMC
eukprot:GHVS01068196.1.p1 GENE.GHVS01068196.1~~GHVS01068196.1.p1  ORF type:complete len:107 (+),score=16.23 GHVS01068196.1:303-623(+)